MKKNQKHKALSPHKKSVSILLLAVLLIASAGLYKQFAGQALLNDLIRPFSANSPLNVPIPVNPAIDAKNTDYIKRLELDNIVANSENYGNAIFDNVDANTPRYPVYVTNDYRNGGPWGSNDLYSQTIPVPNEAMPPAGTDGTVVIVDRPAGKTYYLWQFKRENDRVVTAWGAVHSLNGFGTSESMETGRGTAAGISQLGGTVRIEEVKKGVIDHALVFATHRDQACAGKGVGARTGLENPNGEFRWPAQGSDAVLNWDANKTCLPFGVRVQLDPTLNFDDTSKYPSLTNIDRMVAKAMQKYGAYLIDSGGASMALSFETTQPGDPTWCQLGIAPLGSWACPTDKGSGQYWNYNFMKGKLRVLADCQCGTTKDSKPSSGIITPPASQISQNNNLASNKTFISSAASADGFPLGNINNKNEADRWISLPADNVTVSTDLGKSYTLNKVSIMWAGDTTKRYEIQTSTDNNAWKTIFTGSTNNLSTEIIHTNQFSAVPTGRYLRIVGLERWNASYGHSIFEIGIYGTEDMIVTVPGDANGDGRVNAIDLSIIITKDGQNYPVADFNGDGTVGAADVAILLGKWTW